MDLLGKSCIVTGGGGFIGRYLVQQLCQNGASVIVIDNFSRSHSGNLALYERMVSDLRKNRVGTIPSLRFVSVQSFARQVKEHGVRCYNWGNDNGVHIGHIDFVFHLAAAMGNILSHVGDHLNMLRANARLGADVCDLVSDIAKRNELAGYPPPILIYSSTVCIYPAEPPIPTPESFGRVCDPEASSRGYGIGKWVTEQMFYYLNNEYDIPIRIARFSNAYGAGDYFVDRPHVVPALIRKVFLEPNLVVLGDGNQRRTFVHAADLSNCLIALAQCNETCFNDNGSVDRYIVNIGTETDHSIREVAETILEVTGKNKKIVYNTEANVGHKKRVVDTSKLQRILGQPLPDNFYDTIREMVRDYISRSGAGLLT